MSTRADVEEALHRFEIGRYSAAMPAERALAVLVSGARCWLELLPPADDGTPVTEEWYQAVGFQRGGFDTLVYRPAEHGHPLRAAIYGTRGQTHGAIAFKTRGEVRRMAAVLGAKLKDPK